MEDAAAGHEKDILSLNETCTDLRSRADVALKEVHDPSQEMS